MQHLGEAEVAQEDCEASVQENVRGLEVSVHHFATVQVLLHTTVFATGMRKGVWDSKITRKAPC